MKNWTGATWCAGALAAVAAAHLVRDPRWRVLLPALLMATLGPLLVRGAVNMTIEYDARIQEFESNKAAFYAANGWSEGSSNALIFERRLR